MKQFTTIKGNLPALREGRLQKAARMDALWKPPRKAGKFPEIGPSLTCVCGVLISRSPAHTRAQALFTHPTSKKLGALII